MQPLEGVAALTKDEAALLLRTLERLEEARTVNSAEQVGLALTIIRDAQALYSQEG